MGKIVQCTSFVFFKKSLKILKDSFYLLRMGSGYDNSSHSATSGQSCLANASNENITIGNPSAIITLDQQEGLVSLEKNLDVDVSGEYGGDRFGVSVAAQFANSSKDNAYTTNFIYLYKYAGKALFNNGALKQGDEALTPVALSLVHSDQERFREMCGNEYVEQMDAGAVVAVRLQLSFNSHLDQQKFAAKLKAEYGLVSIAASLQQAATNSNVHVGLSLSALQLGGQPEKLNDLFGHADAEGNYPFINCGSIGGTNEAACKNMISSIITYAQSIQQQLSSDSGTLDMNRLYFSHPSLSKYSTLGIITGAKDPSPEVLHAMELLVDQYDSAIYDYDFVHHYRDTLADRLDTPTAENLRDAENKLLAQINNVYKSPSYRVVNCYRGYVSDQCITIKQNVDNALTEYALSTQQIALIKYLETNSYAATLYNYYGSGEDSAASYKMSPDECIFAPISTSSRAKYAINCHGQWLDSPTSLSMRVSGFDNGLVISGLSYYSISPTLGNNELITYPDVSITPDFEDPNVYYTGDLNVTGGKSFIQPNAMLDIMRLFDNPA